jgi:hypothetical protein
VDVLGRVGIPPEHLSGSTSLTRLQRIQEPKRILVVPEIHALRHDRLREFARRTHSSTPNSTALTISSRAEQLDLYPA